MNLGKLKENAAVFIALFVIFYILVKNALHAPFTVEDEYNNFYWANPDQLFGVERNFFQTLIDAFQYFISLGRLLITHLLVIVTRAKLFGINPLWHHWTVFLFGLGAAFSLYCIFVKASISKLNSFFGALIYITGYSYAEIFFRLSSGECTGNLFLLIAIYFIISFTKNDKKYNFFLSLLAGYLSALSKESYIVLFPFIFAVPFLLIETVNWKAYFIKNSKLIYFAAFCFVTLILTLFLTIKTSGIVFSYGQPLSKFDTMVNNLGWIVKWVILFLPILIAAFIHFLRKKGFLLILPLLLFSAGWIIVQLIVYYKVIISFSQGRYMMPAGLIFILLIVLSLEHFKKHQTKVFYALLAFSGLLIVRNCKIVYINANEFNARATAFNVLIEKMVINKPEKIAIYGGVEFFQSIDAHFIYNHYFPKLITTPVVYSNDYNNPYADEVYKNELQKGLGEQYQLETLELLKNDSTVHIMIPAEPEEYLKINYEAVMKTFTHVEKVAVKFSNPGFGDLLKKQFWTGDLKNAQRTYLIFSK